MRTTVLVLALFSLTLAPGALAHVEPSPEKVPAGGVSRITLSAEGEKSVPAVRLTVQMPAGVTDVVPHPGGGWKPSVHGRVVTWSGGRIANGEEGKFSFTARMPSKPGVIAFPSLVTYADGTVVHWIGAQSSDTPAPRVTLTASRQTNPPPSPPRAPPPPAATTGVADQADGGGGSSWIWIVIVAAIVASLATVFLVRRRRA
jgi:uncharacterized protein YcnI